MDIRKRYVGIIHDIDIMIAITDDELSSFIAHFGKFGDIYVWDKLSNQMILNTKGVYLNKFYPDISDREFAKQKAKEIHDLFKDYSYQRKRKYPKGRLKRIYKIIEMYIENI